MYIHKCVLLMATKTISLDEEAYERLASQKREGESFSDVVKRLAGERSWLEISGILSEDEAENLEAMIEEGRARSRDRSARVVEELEQTSPDESKSE